MKNKSFVSINDLTREKILSLLDTAEKFEANPNRDILSGKVLGSLFFEPSTRTRLSFETKKQEEKAVQYFDPMVPNKQLEDYDLYKNECIWQDKSKKVKIYPCEYFCPTWAVFQNKAFTDKTVAIHWNQSTWWDEKKIEMLKNYKCPLEQMGQPVPVDIKKPKKNIIKKVFSIDNSSDGIYKVITIFGMNIKIKRKHHA